MLSHQLIEHDAPILKASDTASHAMEVLNDMAVSVLPVIEPRTRKLVGLVHKKTFEILDGDIDNTKKLSQYDLQEPLKVYARQHLFEAVRLMLQHEICLIPVVDKEMTYLGLLRKEKVLEVLSHMLNLAKYGSVITVEMAERDYTLSELVQLIEVEEAKILGITVEVPTDENDTYSVSVKLNVEDVSRVSSALRRYGYVISSETEDQTYNVDFEERADELLNYLDM